MDKTKPILVLVNRGATGIKVYAVNMPTFLGDGKFIDTREILIPASATAGDITALFRQFIFDNPAFPSTDVGAIGVRSAILNGLVPGVTIIDNAYMRGVNDPACIGTIHPVNGTPAVAKGVADELGIPLYTADAVSSISPDYLTVAEITGLPGIMKPGYAHYLNMRYVIYLVAKDLGIPIDEVNMVIVHAGGGISVAAVVDGEIIATNNPNEADPFGERAGSLPTLLATDWLYKQFKDGKTPDEVKAYLLKKCGFVGLTGAKNLEDLIQMVRSASGEPEKAYDVFEAMCYQIAGEIMKRWMAVMANLTEYRQSISDFNGLALTGGMFKGPELLNGIRMEGQTGTIGGIRHWIGHVIPEDSIRVFPGEHEGGALATQIIRALRGEIPANYYQYTG